MEPEPTTPSPPPPEVGGPVLPASPAARPHCWKCGYELTGLQVTDACPECGTPVWSTPVSTPQVLVGQIYPEAMVWGIVSLVLLFACIGPLAGFVAIPAVIKGRKAMAMVKTGRYPREAASQAKAGLILGWVTVGLSLAFFLLYAVLFAAGMLF